MVRTVWFAMVALAAALALTVAAPVASGGGEGCPGQYGQYFLSVDDPLFSVDENGNGYICEYLRKGGTKEPFIDDNNKPPKKQVEQ